MSVREGLVFVVAAYGAVLLTLAVYYAWSIRRLRRERRRIQDLGITQFVLAERADRLVKILRQAIIPQATLALQSAQSSYGVGKVDFLTLLNSLLTLQENELELHGEMVEHEKALARLEETVGGFK